VKTVANGRISSSQDTLLAAGGPVVYVAWIVDGALTHRFSTRVLSLDGNEYKPILISTGLCSSSLGVGRLLGRDDSETLLVFSNAYDGNTPGTVETIGDLGRLEGHEVRVGCLFGREDDLALEGESDVTWIVRWRIVRYRIEHGRVLMTCRSPLWTLGEDSIGHLITDEGFPNALESVYGKIIPVVFGSVSAPLLPVSVGWRTALDGAIDDAVTIIPLRDVSGLPASGTFCLLDEEIIFDYVDEAAVSLGSVAHPVTRGDVPVAHVSGEQGCVLVDEWIFAAGQDCVGVTDIRLLGDLSAGSAVEDRELDGLNVTCVVFDDPPRVGTLLPYEDATGLIAGWNETNPAAIIRDYLLVDAMGLDADLIDDETFDAAETALNGYECSRWIADSVKVGDLILDVCLETCCVVLFEDVIRLLVRETSLETAVGALDDGDVLRVERKEWTDVEHVRNRVALVGSERRVYPGRNRGFDAAVVADHASSQGLEWGVRMGFYESHWLADTADLQATATFWASVLGLQETYVTIWALLTTLRYERGDVLTLDLARFGLDYVDAEVHAVALLGIEALDVRVNDLRGFDEMLGGVASRLIVRIPRVLTACWSYNSANTIVVNQSGRIVCYVDSTPIWSLDSDGNMAVSMLVQANVSIAASCPSDGAGYYSSGSVSGVYLTSSGLSNPFIPFLVNRKDGLTLETVLALGDDLVEGQDLSAESPQETCLWANGDGSEVVFTAGGVVVAHYDRTARLLRIAGELQEGRW